MNVPEVTVPELAVQAMIFDADGVIVRPKSWFVTPAAERYGIPRDQFMSFIHGEFQRCISGELELAKVLPPLLEQWRVTVSADAFIRAWLEHEHAIDTNLLRGIQRIRATGLKCYLGTNQEENRAQYMKHDMGLEAALDGVFFSSELKAKKPDPRFYERVQALLDLPASSILLWDDSPANVAAALKASWQAKLYTTFEQFESQLLQYTRAAQ